MAALTYDVKNVVLFNFITTPEVLEKYLPAHTKIDFCNGQCLASLVGSQFENIAFKDTEIPFHTNFEQINLQFYVKRFDGAAWHKGIVYISEIANKPLLSALANNVFHENFVTLPTKSDFTDENILLHMEYSWQFQDEWKYFEVTAEKPATLSEKDSVEEFILEREFIYGKYDDEKTSEFKISHPRWRTFKILNHEMDVDFTMQFGSQFSHFTKPHSVFFADGSSVSVDDHHLVES